MTRDQILNEAKQIVCSDRNREYGEPEDNFGVIADLWNSYLDRMKRSLRADDVAVMMILFKVGRLSTAVNPKMDTYIDIAGYSACAAEIAHGREVMEDETV